MAHNPTEPESLRQLRTWRSGDASPGFPGSGDARRLLDAVDERANGAGCTLVRVRLGASDRRTLVDVRKRLLGEEPIVGTSIGRDAGPDAAETFDILVVPDCDPVTVGRAIVAVDDVVGVAATAFEPQLPVESATAGVDGREDDGTVPEAAVDDALSALSATVDRATDVDGSDELAGTTLDRDGRADAPGPATESSDDAEDPTRGAVPDPDAIGGLAALEDTDGDGPTGSRAPGRIGGSESSGGRASMASDRRRVRSPNGTGEYGTGPDRPERGGGSDTVAGSDHSERNGGDAGFGGSDDHHEGDLHSQSVLLDGRLERLEARLSALENQLGNDSRPALRAASGDAHEDQATLEERIEALEERIEALEAAVSDLERWQRRLLDALVGGSP